MLPPTENRLMPLARLLPLAYAANLEPSGWNAATPRPETITSRITSQYEGAAAASAIPMPASATPAGSSQMTPRRSDHAPKSGWTSDEAAVDASITTAASVYESEKRSTMNGSSAGSAPFAKSVAQWPAESAAIARLSSSARTTRAYLRETREPDPRFAPMAAGRAPPRLAAGGGGHARTHEGSHRWRRGRRAGRRARVTGGRLW